MSTQTAIGIDEARRHAEKEVRKGLGTFCRLKDGEYNEDDDEYVFPLVSKSPRIIEDRHGEVVDVRYYDELDLGRVTVDASTGTVTRPRLQEVRSTIREQKKAIEIAVQKALVSVAGDKLSHLPFPENQYSPLQDILAILLLEGQLEWEEITKMDESRDNDSYRTYTEKLLQIDLANRRGDIITDGNVLIDLNDEAATFQEALNAAVGRYFKHHIGEFTMIKRTLGPYLAIAGRYYRLSLELEEMPRIEEQELREAIQREYSGRERMEKLMKFYRYLIQLENVGVLESVHDRGKRYWIGDDEIRDDMIEESEHLAPMQSLLSNPLA